jgi:ATP-dependent helicase/nuclease subunit B
LLELTPEIFDHLRRGGTLVVPSAQRAAALRLAYAAARLAEGVQVWATPEVLPWGAWLVRGLDEARARGVPVPRRLARAEEWWLWREAVRAACTDDLAVLWPDGLADTVRRAVLLLEDFGLALGDAATPETAVLLRAQAHFRRRCEQLQALWSSSWCACSDYLALKAPTRLTGFGEIGPARRAWLDRLGVKWEAPLTTRTPALALEVRAMDDPDREAATAAQWCAEQLERDPTARLLLIVMRLPEQRHRWLRALTQRMDHRQILSPASPSAAGSDESAVALEGGQPLADYALVTLALQLLALAAGQIEFASLSAVLRSPYLPFAARDSRLRLDVWLRERNVEIRADRLRTLIEPAGRALGEGTAEALRALLQALDLTAIDPPVPAHAQVADWARRFAQVLERAGWPGEQLTSAEQQIRMRFEELLGELAAISIEQAPLAPVQALVQLRQLAASTAYEPASDDVPVTLTSDLSDPIARYDGIWVAGLTADVWPQPLRFDPLIPWAVQRAAGMPMADPAAPLRLAEQTLRQWRRVTDRLVLSFARSEADLPNDPSPLLHEALGHPISNPIAAVAPFELESWLATRAPGLEAVNDATGLPWPTGQALRGGTKLLELQALCPFRAYAQLRLDAQPLPEPAPGIDPSVRGQILHRALELFWGAIGDAATLHARRSELVVLTRESIDRALLEAQRRAPGGLDPQLLSREAMRDERLFELLIEWELARDPFEIEALERTQAIAIGDASLRLRLDRIDRLPDGRLIVFDYKSGADEPFDALAEHLRRPQLPAYALATGERTAAVTALYLTRLGLKLRGVADRAGRLGELKPPRDDEPAWPALQQRWRAQLTELAQQFLRGDAAVDPLPKACDYCHLRTLCRIQLAPATEPDGPAAEPDAPWLLPS